MAMTDERFDAIGVKELCYNHEMRGIIQKRFPSAKIEDARDDVHDSRIAVAIPDVSPREFYMHALDEGYAPDLLGFQLSLRMNAEDSEFFKMVKAWLDKQKAKQGRA